MRIQVQIGVKTRFMFFSVHPETGEETQLSGWCGNTLLTNGLNEMANRDFFTHCHVGVDPTPPVAGDGGMRGFVASTGTVEETTTGLEVDHAWKRKRFRFAVGDAAANLNEVGIAWSLTDGDCVSRALTEDINGDQNTVTPKPDEYLDVVSEMQYWWPVGDTTGTASDINGVAYGYTLRAARTNVLGSWASFIGDKIESYAVGNDDWIFYDGNITGIADPPNGLGYPSDNTDDYTNAYASNSFQIIYGMTVGPGTNGVDAWNANTGLLARTLFFKSTAGEFQIQFDNGGNGIPKTDQFTMNMEFVLGWSEAP